MSDPQPRLLLCAFDVLPAPTGFSRRMTEYLKGLTSRYSVVVLSTKTQDVSHIERYHGSRLLRVPVGTGDLTARLQAFERAVRRQLESEDYGLVHFTDPFGGYVLCELREQYGYRMIYEPMGFPSQDIPPTNPHLGEDKRLLARIRRQELYCLMNADLVFTGSSTSKQFVHSLGVNADAIRVLRAPVDLAPYTSTVVEEPDGDPMRLLYLGSRASWQGLPTLLRALRRAVTQVNVRLSVVGPEPLEGPGQIEEQLEELGLRDWVDLQGPVGHDELHKVVASADVGVVPLEDVERNRQFGGPLAKLPELLAGQRPVIASDLPITRELLPEGAGLFFKAGDEGDLAARIVELARNPGRRVEMGHRGRAEVIRNHDASAIRSRLLDIYDELLGKRPQAPEAVAASSLTGTPTGRVFRESDSSSSPDPVGGMRPSGVDPSKRDTDPSVPPLLPAEPAGAPLRALPAVRPMHTPTRTRLPQLAAPSTEPDAHPAGAIEAAPQPMRTPPPPALLRSPPGSPKPSPSAPIATSPAVAPPSGPPASLRAAPPPHPPAPPSPASPPSRPPFPPASVPSRPPLPPAGAPSRPPLPPAGASSRPPALPPCPPGPPAPSGSGTPPALPDEPEEISPDEVVEAGEAPSTSRIDPWLAQIAHGYCPPEGIQFARPPPPTTFPGRDQLASADSRPPSAPGPESEKS